MGQDVRTRCSCPAVPLLVLQVSTLTACTEWTGTWRWYRSCGLLWIMVVRNPNPPKPLHYDTSLMLKHCCPSLHQMRRWIWMTASGRTSMSPLELSRCSSGSFLSRSSPTGPSMTSLTPSVSDSVVLFHRVHEDVFVCPQGGALYLCVRWPAVCLFQNAQTTSSDWIQSKTWSRSCQIRTTTQCRAFSNTCGGENGTQISVTLSTENRLNLPES